MTDHPDTPDTPPEDEVQDGRGPVIRDKRRIDPETGMPRATAGEGAQSSPAGAGHTAARALPVVGRRTPGTARSAPATLLNNEDFPEPVAPASATTVYSPDSAARTVASGSLTRAPAGPAPRCRTRPRS